MNTLPLSVKICTATPSEGKSKPEIMRILKRYLARETFRHLPRT